MKKIILFLCSFLPVLILAQETSITERTFPETRVVNGHSVETNEEGILKFIIAHRFGAINDGIYNFFGLDDANMRLGFDYGIKRWMTIGLGRSSFNREYDGYAKIKMIRQKKGAKSFPFTLTWFSSAAYKTLRDEDPEKETSILQRMVYAHQLLIARKFSPGFSLQLMPTYIHRNYVLTTDEAHDVLALGIAPRFQISKKVSINLEYYHVFENQLTEVNENSLAIGFDFETKGHVFQLSFGNSRGLIEKAFITETTDKWTEGEIHFGFNITRDFKIKGRKYR